MSFLQKLSFISSRFIKHSRFFQLCSIKTMAAPTSFNEVISPDHAVFKPEPNRYLLYASYACPFAHRTLIARKLKKLDDFIQVVIVDPVFSPERLWQFTEQYPDTFNNAKLLKDIYLAACPNYAGRFSVPVLYDKKTKAIVNTESAEILRIFNSGFNSILTDPGIDLYPPELRKEIDEKLNPWTFSDINRGVYKAGMFGFFCKSQEDYDKNCKITFEALDKVEAMLSRQPWLAGSVLTEADIRLFTTILRFPTVYECHFKCNLKTLRSDLDYPNLFKWTKAIYQIPGIAETVHQDHIKQHYYKSMDWINPSKLVPMYDGPDWSQPRIQLKDSDFAWFKK